MEISKNNTPPKCFQDFSKFNRENFLLDFLAIDWNHLFQNKNPEERIDTMIRKTNEIILQYAPLKLSKQKPNNTHQPWITRGIQ